MGLFGFLAAREATCAACPAPLPPDPLEGYGRKFHSPLCLRHFEKREKRRTRLERRRDEATASQCATCRN